MYGFTSAVLTEFFKYTLCRY